MMVHLFYPLRDKIQQEGSFMINERNIVNLVIFKRLNGTISANWGLSPQEFLGTVSTYILT